MSAYTLDQLTVLCQRFPLAPKILFVPTPQIGYNLTTALAAQGGAWLNLRTTTPYLWAARSAQPHLEAEGRTPLNTHASAFHVESLLTRLSGEIPDHHFSSLPLTPDLVDTFAQTVLELRLAGLPPDTLRTGDLSTGKSDLLVALYSAYLDLLQSGKYYDPASVYEGALRLLEERPPVDQETTYAILDEMVLPGLPARYLSALSKDRVYRVGRQSYGDLSLPPHSAAVRFADAPLAGPDGWVAPAGRLLEYTGLSPEDSARVRLSTAIGAENEVRGILREIASEQLPLDTVEIVYTVDKPYVTLLHDTARAFDLPIAFAAGTPIHLSPSGQSLIGFYAWIGAQYSRDQLVGLLRSGLIRSREDPGEPGAVESYRAAAVLRLCSLVRGRHAYAPAFDRLARSAEPDDPSDDEGDTPLASFTLRELERTRATVQALFELVPEGQSTVSQMVRAGLGFLQSFAPKGDPDALIDELTDLLNGLETELPTPSTAPRLARQFEAILSNRSSGRSVARPGSLYAVPLSQAGYTHRPVRYVIGLDEGAFPGGGAENPILLDRERSLLSRELSLKRHVPTENVWRLIRTLGVSTGTVTLTACTRSLSDGGQTYPSALFQLAREQMGGADAEVRVLQAAPDPEDALDELEYLVAHRRHPDIGTLTSQRYPWLARGRDAVAARRSPEFTRFDGLLGIHPPAHDLASGERLISASRLETLAACPHRYFLRFVLGIAPWEGPEQDLFTWLTPRDFGSAVHRILYRFMRTLAERNERPDAKIHGDLLQERVESEIERYRDRLPVTFEAAYRADCLRLHRVARIFLAVESERSNASPCDFEVSFGFSRFAASPLSCPDPVRLSLTKSVSLQLRGRIDRVDRGSAGYEIWDYKTGSTAPYQRGDLLAGGRHLQWALYALALEQMLGPAEKGEVARSGYLFVGDRGVGQRFSALPPAPEALGDLLEPLLEMAACGAFLHVQKASDLCRYCDYARVCASEARQPGAVTSILESGSLDRQLRTLIERWING